MVEHRIILSWGAHPNISREPYRGKWTSFIESSRLLFVEQTRKNYHKIVWIAEIAVDCKTVRIFAYSSTGEPSNKRSGTRLKT